MKTVQVVIPRWVDKVRGLPTLKAFREGLKTLGVPHRVVDLSEARPAPDSILVCWGIYKKLLPVRYPFFELQERQRKLGGGLIILERGFVRREGYYFAALDGLNGEGCIPYALGEAPEDRWEALGVELRPWRDRGSEALVCGQIPWDTSCQHIDFREWAEDTTWALRKYYPDLRITFRPHPLKPEAVKTEELNYDAISRGALSGDLRRARFVVTFSSTTAVDALIAGVPTIAVDPKSMAYGVTSSRLTEEPTPFSRDAWAHRLAYFQWTHEEMRKGLPWRFLTGART